MSATLPALQADLLRRFRNVTVTRSVNVRKERYHLGAVYDADGALVRTSLRFPDKHRARDPKSLAMVQGLKVERRIRRAIYLGHAFTHFGHFLIETVPALWWARQVDADVALLFHPFDEAGRNVFVDLAQGRDCLALLGLSPDRIVMATADLAVDELLLAPRHYDMRTGPRYDFREIYRDLIAAARNEKSPPPSWGRVGRGKPRFDVRQPSLASPTPTRPQLGGGGTMVYLSRRLLKRRLRRLANDAAVERRMARRGFAIAHPQLMSLVDQINAAAGADLVAGVDGSALHLSVFMRPGARMLVLETTRRRTVHFINALMEVETVSVAAQGASLPKRLDPAALDRALDDLGCPRPGLVGRILNLIDR